MRFSNFVFIPLAFTSHLYAAPICTDSHSDPDGDGWGWENNSSCEISSLSNTSGSSECSVDLATLQAENDQLRQQVLSLQSGTLAVCEDTDPIGDGWGWNGTSSCPIVATVAEQDQANVDHSNTTPTCVQAAERIRNSINPNMSEQAVRRIVGRPNSFHGSSVTSYYYYGASTITFTGRRPSGVYTGPYTYTVRGVSPGDAMSCCVVENLSIGDSTNDVIAQCEALTGG